MLLSHPPSMESEAYQALFEQHCPLQKRLGLGMYSSVYAIRGTQLVAKIASLTAPTPYTPDTGPFSAPVEVEYRDGILLAGKRYDLSKDQKALPVAYMACIEAETLRFLHQAADVPNICSLVDNYFVEAGGDVYLVLVERKYPGKATSYERKNELEIALLSHHVGEVLQTFAELGVIYRDCKPANILQRRSTSKKIGDAILIDFGTVTFTPDAPLPDSLRQLHEERENYNFSRGCTVGTLEYLSPEQAQGKRLTPQSDLFSLGLTLVELLTGFVVNHGGTVTRALRYVATMPEFLQRDALAHLREHHIDTRLQKGIEALLEPLPERRTIQSLQHAAREILKANRYDLNGEKAA